MDDITDADAAGDGAVMLEHLRWLEYSFNAVFHWQIFSPFFVYMNKNRKKLFHWANIPDGVKSESSF